MYDTLISTDDLMTKLDQPDWAIIDCRFSLDEAERGKRDYDQSHIPGSIYAHLNQDLSGPIVTGKTGRHPLPEVDAFSRKLSQWGIDGKVQVVAYDDSTGVMASRLWWMLRWLGHDRVAVLDGGWQKWSSEGKAVANEMPNPTPRNFVASPRPLMVANAEKVMDAVNTPHMRLLDVRSPERYRGEHEPIDPIAGHIPGAMSAPDELNLDPQGRMLPHDALAQRFQKLIPGISTDHVICYCGSGVTACHTLLALKHAGLGDGKLYDGSWSDWITDPWRPIATKSASGL